MPASMANALAAMTCQVGALPYVSQSSGSGANHASTQTLSNPCDR